MDSAEINVLMMDPAIRVLPWRSSVNVFRSPELRIARSARNLFVLVDAVELPEVAEFVTVANRRHQLRALFVRYDAEASLLPLMFERANLRALRNTLVHSGGQMPQRVMNAWRMGAQKELIADARVLGATLFVVTCEPEVFEVSFGKMQALACIEEADRPNFLIAEDGSYIHWPKTDTHVDLDAIRWAVDPLHRKRLARVRALHNRAYGRAIADVRKERGLRQTDITGLSDRQVRRIEEGEGVTVASLRTLAAAHGMGLKEYLNALAERGGSSSELEAFLRVAEGR